jgi:hypothetical protein
VQQKVAGPAGVAVPVAIGADASHAPASRVGMTVSFSDLVMGIPGQPWGTEKVPLGATQATSRYGNPAGTGAGGSEHVPDGPPQVHGAQPRVSFAFE